MTHACTRSVCAGWRREKREAPASTATAWRVRVSHTSAKDQMRDASRAPYLQHATACRVRVSATPGLRPARRRALPAGCCRRRPAGRGHRSRHAVPQGRVGGG